MVVGMWISSLGPFAAQPSNAQEQLKLAGVITDSMCGAKHMIAGDDAKCVRTCVKGGSHFALLVGDKVYQLNGHEGELDKLAGKRANVAGALNADGALEVASVTLVADKASSAAASPDNTTSAPTVTIAGLVRDISCPLQNKNATARKFNLKCAQDCVRLGSPLIILTDDGIIYVPISESMPDQDQRARLVPFAGKYVQVQGQVFERGGIHAIMLQDIKELKEVHLVTDAE